MADLYHMERKMAWKEKFKDQDDEIGDENNFSDQNPFSNKARKTNMPKQYHEGIKQFKNCVQSDIIGFAKASTGKVKSNLTKDEKKALDSLVDLQKKGKIIIQPADKSGGICVMDREDYVAEADRQLHDSFITDDGTELKYYEQVDHKEIAKQYKEVEENIIKFISTFRFVYNLYYISLFL